MFFNPEVVVICEDEFSTIGTLLGKAILFSPDAKLYVIMTVLFAISISLMFSGRCAEIVDFDGSPA